MVWSDKYFRKENTFNCCIKFWLFLAKNQCTEYALIFYDANQGIIGHKAICRSMTLFCTLPI